MRKPLSLLISLSLIAVSWPAGAQVRVQPVPVSVGSIGSVGAAGAALTPAAGPGAASIQPSLTSVGSVLPGASLHLPAPLIQAHPSVQGALPSLGAAPQTEAVRTAAAGAPVSRSLPPSRAGPCAASRPPSPPMSRPASGRRSR